MKRSPLKRTPFTATRKAIKRVSDKRSAKIPERQALRADQLRRKPRCEARLQGCMAEATDVHEIVNRSQDAEAWLKPHLFLSLCRPCHHWVTTHPIWARHHGYTLSRVHDDPQHLDAAARARARCASPKCMNDHMEAL